MQAIDIRSPSIVRQASASKQSLMNTHSAAPGVPSIDGCIRSCLHLSLGKQLSLLEVLPFKAMRDSTDARSASAGGK